MTTMTIRNIDDRLKQRLRIQAARHGRSMEEEARHILRSSLSADAPNHVSLIESIRARIEPLGGIDLQLPPREPIRAPPSDPLAIDASNAQLPQSRAPTTMS